MTETAPKPPWWRRIRIRIGIRGLMILVLLIGGGLGWIVRGAKIQREAVAALEGEGGIYYDWQWDSKRVTVLKPSEARLSTPKWLIDRVGVDYFHHVSAIMIGNPSSPAITEDVMAQVARLERLDYLSLDGELTCSSAMMAHFRGLTRLRQLELDVNGGKNGNFVSELKSLQGLEHLALSHATDSELPDLSGLTWIKWLWIEGDQITDAGLAHLAGMTGLEELHLCCSGITGTGLNSLKGMSHLKSLDLSRANISDAGVEVLAKFPGLVSLDLSSTHITDQGLVHLRGLTNLTHLELNDTNITDAGLTHIASLTGLQSLGLSSTQISDAGLIHLSGLNKLTDLAVGNTKITDQGIINLNGLESCKEVSVDGPAITDAGIATATKKRPGIRFFLQDYPCFP